MSRACPGNHLCNALTIYNENREGHCEGCSGFFDGQVFLLSFALMVKCFASSALGTGAGESPVVELVITLLGGFVACQEGAEVERS